MVVVAYTYAESADRLVTLQAPKNALRSEKQHPSSCTVWGRKPTRDHLAEHIDLNKDGMTKYRLGTRMGKYQMD